MRVQGQGHSASLEIEMLKQQHEAEMDGMRRKHKELQQVIHEHQEFRERSLHEEVSKHQERHRQEMADLKSTHESELARLHTAELNKLRDGQAERAQLIKRLHEEHEQHLSSINQRINHTAEETHLMLINKHALEVTQLKKQHEDEIRDVTRKHSTQLQLQAQSHDATHIDEIKKIKMQHVQALASLKAAVETNKEPVASPGEIGRRLRKAQHSPFMDDKAAFRFLIVADLDKQSREQGKKPIFFSFLQEGMLQRHPRKPGAEGAAKGAGHQYSISWQGRFRVRSMLGEAGRGLELSELVDFNGHFLTMDDRSGVVFELHNSSKPEGMASKKKGGDGMQGVPGSRGDAPSQVLHLRTHILRHFNRSLFFVSHSASTHQMSPTT
jgi:hypothetical protein